MSKKDKELEKKIEGILDLESTCLGISYGEDWEEVRKKQIKSIKRLINSEIRRRNEKK